MPTQVLGNGHDLSIRAQKKEEFLEQYVKDRNISRAAKAIGICPATVYNWKDNDPEFAKAVLIAERCIGDHYHEQADKLSKKSELMTIFLLKRYHPEFRETNKVQVNQFNIDGKNLLHQLRDLGNMEPTQSIGSNVNHEADVTLELPAPSQEEGEDTSEEGGDRRL